MSGWRPSALSSIETLASSAITSRSDGDDQRVDLDEHRVALREHVVELREQGARRADDVRVDAARERELASVEGAEADQRVDVNLRDRLVGDFFDVHAALRREHHERLLRAAVEDDRGVVLGGDVGGTLDPDLLDLEAADVHAEDRVGVRLRLVGVLGDLDPAGLAAAADLHLCLDDDRKTEALGRLARRLRSVRMPPLGDRHAVLGEDLLSLVFE